MDNKRHIVELKNARAEIFSLPVEDGVSEYHVMVHVTDGTLCFQHQVEALLDAYDEVIRHYVGGAQSVFKRYFLSDAANQTNTLLANLPESADCAVSIVQQAPLDGTKIALWVYLLTGVKTRNLSDGLYEAAHGAYRHLWTGGNQVMSDNSEYQTRILLNNYILKLNEQGCTLADNCIRTWFFVQDIDNNYAGMVKARNEVFVTQNLTEKTHYIASTGIGGRTADPKIKVLMDAYSVAGLKPGQTRFLYALDHLNRTSDYGVSFERGTCVDYGDRRQVFISGTASIDNKGQVLHVGDIVKQTERMLENVECLLHEGGMTFHDIGQMTVYLRDIADYAVVKGIFDERFPDMPKVFVNAPVCRPTWLIEVECMGVKSVRNEGLADF